MNSLLMFFLAMEVSELQLISSILEEAEIFLQQKL